MAVALCLVIITCTLSLYFFSAGASRATRRTAAAFAESIKETFNFTPKITVDRTLVFQESKPVAELAVRKQTFEHRMQWSSTWLGSTKTIQLNGVYTASAGFDLKRPFSVDFNSRLRLVTIRYPRPGILSVQLDSINISQDEGWWNSITDADRNEVLNRFTADARAKVAQTALLEKTEEDFQTRLRELLSKSGLTVVFSAGDERQKAADGVEVSPAFPAP